MGTIAKRLEGRSRPQYNYSHGLFSCGPPFPCYQQSQDAPGDRIYASSTRFRLVEFSFFLLPFYCWFLLPSYSEDGDGGSTLHLDKEVLTRNNDAIHVEVRTFSDTQIL